MNCRVPALTPASPGTEPRCPLASGALLLAFLLGGEYACGPDRVEVRAILVTAVSGPSWLEHLGLAIDRSSMGKMDGVVSENLAGALLT